MQPHIIKVASIGIHPMKSLFPHLAAELINRLTAQSSVEAEPTTISGGKSSLLPQDNGHFTGIYLVTWAWSIGDDLPYYNKDILNECKQNYWCRVKWSIKPENAKMLGKSNVVIASMWQSFFGCFIYWGMFNKPPKNQNIKKIKNCGFTSIEFSISVVSLYDVGNSYQGKIGVFLYFFAIKAVKWKLFFCLWVGR